MNFKNTIGLAALFTILLGTSTHSFADSINDVLENKAPSPHVNDVGKNTNTKVGQASWYGRQFHGRKTASGERYNMNGLTAAHRYLPFGTKLKVTCKQTGKSVIVRVNDRGPFHGNRVLDLSKGAAQQLGLTQRGVGSVKIEKIK